MTFVEILCPSCALFLDFDGTMVDIAPQPHAVHVPEPLICVLQDLNEYLQGAVAVISGRPIARGSLLSTVLPGPPAAATTVRRARAARPR